MEDSRELLLKALKVLSAMIAGQAADPSDVKALRKMSILPADAEPDDVACYVAQKVLAKRGHEGRIKVCQWLISE